jgi:hypothetical protein
VKRALGICAVIGALALVRPFEAQAVSRDDPPEPEPLRALEPTGTSAIKYVVRVTDDNLMGLTVTNYGFIGNNFISRSPSMEYPLGSGFEHLVRAGLWFGASAIDTLGGFIGVATGAVDGVAGGAGSQYATEYTPAGDDILVRSTLLSDPHYNPSAISELDFVTDFNDLTVKTATSNREPNRPIGLLVHQENYMWSFSDYTNFVIFHYTIKNLGPPLANAWVGIYAELASGNKNSYSSFPPSSSWYGKKWLQYDDSLRLFREHYCLNTPVPTGCALETAPFWAGIKLLGVKPDTVANKRITVAAWGWAPGDVSRDEDTERYAIMSSGAITDLTAAALQPNAGDPVELFAVGPFQRIDPDSTIEVDFAFVGGIDSTDIQTHSKFAQRAYDRHYIVPVPPPSPRMRVVARDRALDLYWDDSPESALDPTSPSPKDFEGYRIYAGTDRLAPIRVAQFDLAASPNDTTGFNTGLDSVRLATPEVVDGVTYRYKYTIPALKNGFKYFCSVTSYDLGTKEIESLESGINQNKTMAIPAPDAAESAAGSVVVFPNPYRVEARWDQGTLVRDHYLWFANLPKRSTIRIYTLSGDMVFQTEFDGANYHGEGARGIYDPKRELDVPPPTLSGAMYGWDLITREGQAAATGLYLYSVEDRDTGKRTVGKFLLVKSDREEF